MATYRPDPAAAWFAAVRGGVVLMTPATAAGDLAALWPDLTAADPTAAVLDRLTAGGLAATPSFALVVRDAEDDSARVVVRGEPRARAGDTEVSGDGVATWAERVVSGDVEVVVPDAAPDGPGLPIVEGIVPASSVRSECVEPVAVPPAIVGPAEPVVVPIEPLGQAAPTPPPVTPGIPFPPPPAPLPPPPGVAAEQTIVPAEETVAGPVTPTPLDGDHDGLTVASIDLRRLRAERAARAGATPASDPPAAPVAAPTPPTPLRLRMPDGALELLGHEVLLGRAPSVSQVSGGRLPRLITIGAGDPDISRNHVRIAVEGDTVVVTDLHSRNGTHVVAPGKPPVKLRGGEPTPLLAGTVVDLGGGWSVQVVAE